MSLDWWEFYEVKGNLKTIITEMERLRVEIAKLKKEVDELKGKGIEPGSDLDAG
jgi:uncharacterized protein (UPF0335 family)